MAKLQDMFTQARRAQSGGGIGFLGKNRSENKPHSAAIVAAFTQITAGSAEAALKAGADGLLFAWDGKDTTAFETLKQEIDAAKASNENAVVGLNITGNLATLDQESLQQIKEQGIQYIILPFDAPARLLALEGKELEKVVIVPRREGEIYPIYIHNLTAFDGINAVLLDFELSDKIGSMSIEEVLDYRAIREAVRFPAFLHVKGNLTQADAFTISTLGIQALVLTVQNVEESTREQIKDLRTLLEKVYEEEKEKDTSSGPGGRSR
ncbi:MAG: hypothetical protein H0U76_26590 [Ktedonobacteraceae bacterium]|nr:hypothetical protein [Ktedonobacteraceae bacterium]